MKFSAPDLPVKPLAYFSADPELFTKIWQNQRLRL